MALSDHSQATALGAIVQDSYIVRFTSVATLALLVYDYAITFRDEASLIWPSRFSVTKISFLLNRYLPFLGTTGMMYVMIMADPNKHDKICRTGFLISGSIVFTSYVIAEFILYIRTYAVSGGKLSMFILIFTTLVAVYALGTSYTALFLRSIHVLPMPVLQNGCVVYFENQIGWIAFIVLLISETFALVVLSIKSFQMSQSTLMRKMLADGVIYYVLIVASSVGNLVLLRVANPTICNFLIVLQASLHSIFCNRLLLNIRNEYSSISTTVTSNFTSRTTQMAFIGAISDPESNIE